MTDTVRDPLLQGRVDENEAAPSNNGPVQPVSVDGYLKKKNRYGFWQKRFFVLDGVEFMYYSNKQRQKKRGPLIVVSASLNGRFGAFDVETETRDLELKADNLRDAELWVQKIEEAEEQAELIANRKNHTLSASPIQTQIVRPDMEGYLEMPSGIRFKPWQDRYFRLRNTSLYFYKDSSKAFDDFEGEMLLVDPANPQKTIVELTDSSNGRGFAVHVGSKDYKFRAPTADAAKDWVVALQHCIAAPTSVRVSDVEEKSEIPPPPPNMMPKWMVDWDNATVEENVYRIQVHLDTLFPKPDDPEFKKNTLNAVTLLLEELDDKARECLPANGVLKGLTVTNRESRPDIFEFIIRFFHVRIIDKLSQLVSDQSYGNMSIRELLRFMDLITAYDMKIKEILQGEVGEAILSSLQPFDLLDNAENMAIRYARVCEEQVSLWVENVTFQALSDGESRVFVRLDGRYQTSGPTDIFNLLDQALQLGKVSGLKSLQADIVAMCAVAKGVYIVNVTNDLVKRKSDSLPLACAVANDCWSMIEQVNKLESEHRNDSYRINLEPVREKCAVSADRCLEVLASMVVSDLRGTLDQLFTENHLKSVLDSEDSIAVVCATMDDYLEDFQHLLEVHFVIRVSRMMVRDIIALYVARLAHAYTFDRRVELAPREIELVKLDRKRIMNCLQSRFSNIDIALIFASELQPLDDILEMLTEAPALIPQTAVKICQRDPYFGPYLRPFVTNTAKMCVDLQVNGSGSGNDKLVREIKALIMTEVDEKITGSASNPMPDDKYEIFDRMGFVRMWPQVKRPAIKKTEERMLNVKATLKEQTIITKVEIVPEKRPKMVQRENSTYWQKFSSDGEAKRAPQSDEINGPPAIVLTPLISGMLRYKGDAKAQQHIDYFCSVRPISETHATDYEFVVFKGKSSANPNVFRVRISDIARVSFWDESGPKHFGSDGKIVSDPPPTGTVAGKKSLDFAVAKNSSEFVIVNKNGEKVHLIAESSDLARDWVNKIRGAVADSFEKWGISFVEGQQEYTKMSVSQLKELAKKRGVDLRGCVEKLDMIRMLKNSNPAPAASSGSASPATAPVKPATEVDHATAAMTPTTTEATSPVAMDPQLSINNQMFSVRKPPAEQPAVSAPTQEPSKPVTPPVAPAAAPSKLKETMSMPVVMDRKDTRPVVASAAAASVPKPAPRSDAPPIVPIAAPASSGIVKKSTEPLLATSSVAATSKQVNGNGAAASAVPARAAPPEAAAAAAAPVRAVSAPVSHDFNPQEEQILEVQSLIVRGHMLIEEGQPAQASQQFKKAKEMAEKLQNIQLKAKANAGLAASYRDQESMRRVAGTLFEVAAHFHALSGDSSDRLTCIREAADVYLQTDKKSEAIRVMEAYDKAMLRAGQPAVFADRIRQLKSG